jgi:hypothetical protein
MDLGDNGLGKALEDGKTLFSFLGQFWHHVYQSPEFAERFCEAAGLLSAQVEQRKNEAKAASGRKLLPVYSRERWMCVKLAPDTKNTGTASCIHLGADAPVIGPQAAGSGYPAHLVPRIGPGSSLLHAVTYKLPACIVSAESLHERAFDPEVSLSYGADFDIFEDSIRFMSGSDPASDGRFRKDVDGGGVVVWLKNALVDKNYVADYAGYVLKMNLPSSKRNLDAINAFWDIVNTGATVGGLSYFVCKALGVPCAEGRETVSEIRRDGDSWVVETDRNTYVSAVEPSVSAGKTLARGAPLTGAVRLVEDIGRSTDAMDVLFLKQGFFLDGRISGLGFPNEDGSLVFCGTDPDGKPRIKFPVYGNPGDADLFFSEFWRRCAESGIGQDRLFDVEIQQNASVGDVLRSDFNPAMFMWKNLVGTNVAFVRIDLGKLDEEGVAAAGLLSRAFEVVPPGVCLVFCMSPAPVSSHFDCNGVQDGDSLGVKCKVHGPERIDGVSESVVRFVVPGREVNNT